MFTDNWYYYRQYIVTLYWYYCCPKFIEYFITP